MKQPGSIESRTHYAPSSAPAARRILVVDDAEDSREVLARFLGLQGHRVRTANDGLDGLVVASKFRPQIIFLELRMPRMDGFELCARLRVNPLTKDAAVFALTGRSNDGMHPTRVQGGFDAYLHKPLECDVIEGLIKSAANGLPRS